MGRGHGTPGWLLVGMKIEFLEILRSYILLLLNACLIQLDLNFLMEQRDSYECLIWDHK